MNSWGGSAGLCISTSGEVLMVLQGTPEEKKTWSIPSGGLEPGETFEECCRREFKEEIGFTVEVLEEVTVKKGRVEELDMDIIVHYFLVEITGGEMKIADPDQLIHDIAWKSPDEIRALNLSFPEDREFLLRQPAQIKART